MENGQKIERRPTGKLVTDGEKLAALAQMDGWKPHPNYCDVLCQDGREAHIGSSNIQQYLTSYDAIIPLIQKQPMGVKITIECHTSILSTTTELADALLAAKGFQV